MDPWLEIRVIKTNIKMNTISLEAQPRTEVGKKATKALRKAKLVPCVLYGGEKNLTFTVPELQFSPIVFTPNFNVIDLTVEGATYKSVLKDIQFHPVTDQILHVDLMELVDDRKITVDIPLKFEGLALGVRNGGKLMVQLRKMRVKAFPKDLLPELVVDVTDLELGRSVKVGSISFDNIELMNNPNLPIVSVEIPRALKSAEAEEGAEGAEAEGAEAAAAE